MSTSFDDAWVPRIGKSATAELHRNGTLTLLTGPGIFLCAIIASSTFSAGSLVGLVIGCMAVVIAVALCTMWFRSRVKLADLLSERFKTKLRWYEIPNMKENQFDAWCRRRNLQADD